MNACIGALADECPGDVVDIAAAGVAVDHGAHRQSVLDQRQVYGRIDVAARIAVGGRRIAGIDSAFGDVELRLVGDIANHAGFRARAEQRPLRALEDLDALEIRRVDIEIASRQLCGLVIKVHRDVGEITDGPAAL